jgi:hypothetical protein
VTAEVLVLEGERCRPRECGWEGNWLWGKPGLGEGLGWKFERF